MTPNKERKQFFQPGCFDSPASERETAPCLAGWQPEDPANHPEYNGSAPLFTCAMLESGAALSNEYSWLLVSSIVIIVVQQF